MHAVDLVHINGSSVLPHRTSHSDAVEKSPVFRALHFFVIFRFNFLHVDRHRCQKQQIQPDYVSGDWRNIFEMLIFIVRSLQQFHR